MTDILRKLMFHNMCIDKDDIWFWDINYNALFKGKEGEEEAEIVYQPDYAYDVEGSLVGTIVKCKNKIIGTPCISDKIFIFDIESGKAKWLDLSISEWNNLHAETRGRFMTALVKDHFVYMIGYWSSLVLKFDAERERIVDIVDLYIDTDIPIEKRYLCLHDAVIIDNRIYVPNRVKQEIFVIDTENMFYDCKNISSLEMIEGAENGYNNITFDGENLWLFSWHNNPIVKININDWKMDYLNNFPEDLIRKKGPDFVAAFHMNEYIWALPKGANKIIKISKKTNKIYSYTHEDTFYETSKRDGNSFDFIWGQKSSDGFFCYDLLSRCVYHYSKTKDKWDTFYFCSKKAEFIKSMILCKGWITSENAEILLEDYLFALGDKGIPRKGIDRNCY